jgi:hypothetical protein
MVFRWYLSLWALHAVPSPLAGETPAVPGKVPRLLRLRFVGYARVTDWPFQVRSLAVILPEAGSGSRTSLSFRFLRELRDFCRVKIADGGLTPKTGLQNCRKREESQRGTYQSH